MYEISSCGRQWQHILLSKYIKCDLTCNMANNLLNIILLYELRKLWNWYISVLFYSFGHHYNPDSKVHGANMGPTWGPPGSYRPQMGPMLAHEPCYQGKALDEEAYNTSEIKSYTYILLEMNHAADEKVIRYKWDWIIYIIIILTVGHAWLFRLICDFFCNECYTPSILPWNDRTEIWVLLWRNSNIDCVVLLVDYRPIMSATFGKHTSELIVDCLLGSPNPCCAEVIFRKHKELLLTHHSIFHGTYCKHEVAQMGLQSSMQ